MRSEDRHGLSVALSEAAAQLPLNFSPAVIDKLLNWDFAAKNLG